MKSRKIYTIVILSIYTSIIIILTFVPYTGYLQFGPLAITTIPVVISIATYDLGFSGAITTSLAFGIGSYLRATTLFPSLMVDPTLSIVPRIMVGLFIYLIYKILGKLKLWKFTVLTIFCVLLNSFFVSLFYFIDQLYNDSYKKSFIVWIVLIYINFIFELTTGIFLSLFLFKILKIRQKHKYYNKLNSYH